MDYLFISTTSKNSTPLQKLPSKQISDHFHDNFIVTDRDKLSTLLEDYKQHFIVADCETKRGLSLLNEVQSLNVSNKLIDYKPNDITVESTDIALLNYFDNKISDKSIGIYGTGNIAFKIALRLVERNVNVHLYGRDESKIMNMLNIIKQVGFNESLVHIGDISRDKLDGFVSFVTAEQVITSDYLNILKDHAICLDGGIGNFSYAFIEKGLEYGHDIRRVDVRQANSILEGYIKSRIDNSFNNIIGRKIIDGVSVVAGGIIGRKNEVIVDQIVNPTRVIGIANGIGGVKDAGILTGEEENRIEIVWQSIRQNSETYS